MKSFLADPVNRLKGYTLLARPPGGFFREKFPANPSPDIRGGASRSRGQPTLAGGSGNGANSGTPVGRFGR